jgi:L-alanine-DL-glutamate epimerase-like enolase superfamily enzyme
MKRRTFMKGAVGVTVAAHTPVYTACASEKEPSYHYHGRIPGYREHRIIEPGLTISKIETFTKDSVSIVRVQTDDGTEGYGQISTYDADLSALALHRKLAGHVLGKDPADIDAIVDRCIEANYKYPWSYVCRALAGIDTAIWDLYGKIKQKPVVELLGGKSGPYKPYGSSMRRDIKPQDEADRLKRLQEEHGFFAFKIRVGKVNGHNTDAWPGRTEALIPAVHKALGDDVELLVDANSCYTPDKAVEVGKMLQDHGYYQYEEPCPYWELEWTQEVTEKLNIAVSGGEQDNDLAQWRRMIKMHAVDIVQPDICYIGGITRALRVAQMAAEAKLRCVPHSANLSLVTLFSVHLLGAIPNAEPYLEYTIEYEHDINRQARAMYSPQLVAKDGFVEIPADPGWGIQIHEAWLDKADYQISEQ